MDAGSKESVTALAKAVEGKVRRTASCPFSTGLDSYSTLM